jgi:hypothetical protein
MSARTGSRLIGIALIALLPMVLVAQDTPQPLEIQADIGKAPQAVIVGLRPNQPTAVALTLQNPGEEELRNVVVKLVQINGDEVRVLGQTAEVEKLAAKAKVRLEFPKSKDKKENKEKEKDKDKDKKDAPGLLDLGTPPFKVQTWVEARLGKDLVTVKKDLLFVIREPRDYVAAQAQYEQTKHKVEMKVRLGNGTAITGPALVPLDLVLGPELLPSKKGTFTQKLTEPKQSIEMFAEDLAFAGLKIGEGRVYLTVDGYERAFTFPVTLAGSGDLDELPLGKRIGARIRVPRYAKPMEKFPVALEMDGPTDGDYQVEVGLDRTGMRQEFETKKFIGLRQQSISVKFSDKGDLVCQTRVRDWQTEFDTTGVYGNIVFRVSVTRRDELVPLLVTKETRHNVSAQENGDGKRLFARVTVDDTPPQGIEFFNTPRDGYVARAIPVMLRVKMPQSHQAPIEEKVVFFRGKPAPDGKVSPDAILGYGRFDPDKGVCIAVLPPPEKAEELPVTAQFMTASGVPATKTVNLVIHEAKFAPTKIKGVVAHGANGQPNVTLTLADEKMKPLNQIKSGPKGDFLFSGVLPGKYVIYANVNFPALVGNVQVEVPEGKEVVDNVAIRLLAK